MDKTQFLLLGAPGLSDITCTGLHQTNDKRYSNFYIDPTGICNLLHVKAKQAY